MASQDGQWMLWAKRLKDEHKILLQRIDTATQQIKEIAAGPTDLQSENKSLKERIVRLEEESRDRQRRMLILEEDAVDRKQNMIRQNGDAEDREQVLGNEIQELKGRITELEKVLTRTVENVENSHKPLQILNEVQERQQPERPRLQSHDSVAVASVAFNQEVRIGMALNLLTNSPIPVSESMLPDRQKNQLPRPRLKPPRPTRASSFRTQNRTLATMRAIQLVSLLRAPNH